MSLTNQEEKELQSQIKKPNIIQETKYKTKNAHFCKSGHKLNYVYWRSHIEKRLGKIPGLFFCPKCDKLFKMTIVEISNEQL